jgi:hypothetical protein
MKTPLNVLIRPETLNALLKALEKSKEKHPTKTLSVLTEDAIINYLGELGIPVNFTNGSDSE